MALGLTGNLTYDDILPGVLDENLIPLFCVPWRYFTTYLVEVRYALETLFWCRARKLVMVEISGRVDMASQLMALTGSLLRYRVGGVLCCRSSSCASWIRVSMKAPWLRWHVISPSLSTSH
eukprot:9011740-Ditylum_brightwellii.AAC.1